MAYPYDTQPPTRPLSRSERLSRHLIENRMRYMGVFGVIVIIIAAIFLVPMLTS